MTKWNLSQVCKSGSTLEKSVNIIHRINKLKKKNHIIVSTDTIMKSILQNPIPIYDTKSQKTTKSRKLPRPDK